MGNPGKKVALVTGANRGIGFETCRQLGRAGLIVILAARDEAKGERAAEKLRGEGLDVRFRQLDVTDEGRIRAVVRELEREFGRVDVLVNNAGILEDTSAEGTFGTSPEKILRTFRTNTLGPFLLCQAVFPLMRRNGYGRIVNLSSGMGQLSEMEGGYPAYRISKTALNAVTRVFAAEADAQDIQVNSVCPGWVATEMGGEEADRTPEEGADTVVWLATHPENGPNGAFFRDRENIDW